jgi:glycosyltransferase involved in cell wall biosynthesis
VVIFFDINTFFSPKAGGIRTYHQAKIEWFGKHQEHAYTLVFPGPSRKTRKTAPNVTLAEGLGPALTKDPSGYRLLLDFVHVYKLIRRAKPDVLEAGDAWLTGLFCLFLRKSGLFKGLLVSFYHSDPVPSYFEPWASKGSLRGFKRALVRIAAPVFYRLQGAYDLTAVSSKVMEARLRAKGVRAVAYLPFGVPAMFMEGEPVPRPHGKAVPAIEASGAAPSADGDPGASREGEGEAAARSEIRILYAGRLDREKGVDLVLEALPKLLGRGNVRVTIAGRGAMAPAFSAFKHARYEFRGFVEGQGDMRALYDTHHILIAPGPYETFGLGVLEAMARGLVAVGPDQGGTGELLAQAGSPFIFKAGDGEDFLRKAFRAIDGDWPAESARARALALKYGTWDDAVGRMANRYGSRLGAGML